MPSQTAAFIVPAWIDRSGRSACGFACDADDAEY
jgi:hypothetical protein